MTVSITSGYDMLEEMDEIASRYFSPNLSKNRTGMYGFTTESMARVLDNSLINTLHKSREHFAYTAQEKKTLLTEMEGLGITTGVATPAIMDMFVGIPVTSIFEKGTEYTGNYEFIIDKDTEINIGEFTYMLDYDLRIYAKLLDNGTYNYSAKYMVTEDNPLTSFNNAYLISVKSINNNVEYVMVRIDARQVRKEYQYHQVLENDQVSLTGLEFPYDDQLAYFNIWYKAPEDLEYRKITPQSILSKSRPNSDYLLFDNTEYNENENRGYIKLSAESAFIPAFNSEIRLDIFTTKGKTGNFQYTNVADNGSNIVINLKSYEDIRDYIGIEPISVSLGDSLFGSNIPTLEELRTQLIEYKSSLGGLDTENDLSVFFNKFNLDSTMYFVKKRNDVRDRRYSAYLIPRFDDGTIIPTTTMKIEYDDGDFDEHYTVSNRYIIKANTKFSLKAGETTILEKNDNDLNATEIIDHENDPTKLLFGTPYLIVANESPESMSFYNNSIDNTHQVRTEYINDLTTTQFVINEFNISRNAVHGDDEYTMTFNIIPTGDISDIVDTDGTIKAGNILLVKGFAYTSNAISGYFDITLTSYNKDDNYFSATATLETDDFLSLNNELRIINTIKPSGAGGTTDTLLAGTDLTFGIGVYHKLATNLGKGAYEGIVTNVVDYTLVNVYNNTNDKTSLFTDVTNNIHSTLLLPSANDFHMYDIPLIRYSVLQSKSAEISKVLDNVIKILNSMIKIVKNNFSIDMKFYRTYGASSYFKVGESATTLDKLNLKLKFRLHLKINPIVTGESNVYEDIKKYIKTYIETLNTSTVDHDNNLYASNVVTATESQFPVYIKSIDLIKINDYTDNPRILSYDVPSVLDMTSDQLRDYIPEYLNIDEITFDIY